MTKTCPNCGVNSPDNAKHCIECGENIEDVPINNVKEPSAKPKTTANTSSSSSGDSSPIGCIILIAIVAVVIVAAGFFIFGGSGGSGESNQQNISITFDQVYAHDYQSSGKTYYSYTVSGFINNFPKDMDGYMIKTIYYDSNGNEVTSETKKLSYFENYKNSNYATTLSSYYTENYVNIDHVTVQIIKDNNVLNQFNSTMNKNKLTSIVGSSSSVNNSSNLSNLSR